MTKTLFAVSLVLGIATGCVASKAGTPSGPVQPDGNGVLRPPGQTSGDCGAASLQKTDGPCQK